MEIVLVTRKRSVGIDDDSSGMSDFEYLSLLPGYNDSIGVLSNTSLNMLPGNRKNEIKSNSLGSVTLTKKGVLLSQNEDFHLYKIKDVDPVLYEVLGYNCLVNFKGDCFHGLSSLKSFLFRDYDFSDEDFNALEETASYMVCSYYEGEAAFIYTSDELAEKIINDFNKLCMEKCGTSIVVEELT